MNFAYSKWNNDELFQEWAERYNWSSQQTEMVRREVDQKQFLKQLKKYERIAVMFGNMNYQVHNGGFMQWYDNGYGKYKGQILTALKEVYKDTGDPLIQNLIDLLKEVDGRVALGGNDRWLSDKRDRGFYDIMGEEGSGGAIDIIAEWIVDKAALDYGDMILWAAED